MHEHHAWVNCDPKECHLAGSDMHEPSGLRVLSTCTYARFNLDEDGVSDPEPFKICESDSWNGSVQQCISTDASTRGNASVQMQGTQPIAMAIGKECSTHAAKGACPTMHAVHECTTRSAAMEYATSMHAGHASTDRREASAWLPCMFLIHGHHAWHVRK